MNAKDDSLGDAVSRQDVQRVAQLIDDGYIVQLRPDHGDTVLHLAAQKGNESIVEMLLSANGKQFLNTFDDDLCWSPLIGAIEKGHLGVARLLILAGSDVNAKDSEKLRNPALVSAIQTANVEAVVLLLVAGANPHVRGWMQLSAIDQALSEVKRNPTDVHYDILSLVEKAGEHFRYVAVDRGASVSDTVDKYQGINRAERDLIVRLLQ